jgi:hypothetical protein
MKMIAKTTICLSAVITGLVAGCDVYVRPPEVVATVPAPPPGPVVGVEVGVPPTYVWDGVEFVGEYNGGFVYLNPGGIWVGAPPFVLDRFHGWERGHPDWRRGAIRYDRAHRPDPHRGPERRREER